MKRWIVNISLAGPRNKHREVEMEVRAITSRGALIKAISQIDIHQGELFHQVHISRPVLSGKLHSRKELEMWKTAEVIMERDKDALKKLSGE